MISLDALGRTLAYGRGKGVTRHLSVCPRTGRVAELAYDGSTNTSRLTIRDGRSLRVVGQRAVHLPGSRHPHGLLCENASGSEVVVFAYPGDRRGHALYRLTNGTPREIWHGSAYLSSLVPGAAYLNAGLPDGKRLTKVDLRTGRVQRIATLPLRPRLVPDATGRRLAGIAYRIQRRSRLVLVDLRGKAPVVRWVALDAREVDGDVHFLPNGRLLFLPTAGDTARVLDGSLRTLHRFPWAAHDSALVGTRAWGVDRTGELVSAPVPGGPGRTVRQLPGGARPEVIVSATR